MELKSTEYLGVIAGGVNDEDRALFKITPKISSDGVTSIGGSFFITVSLPCIGIDEPTTNLTINQIMKANELIFNVL